MAISQIVQNSIANTVSLAVKIQSIQVANSSYAILDDTSVDTAGGYIVITGAGFQSNCQVLVGSNVATSVTFVNSTTIRAQIPAAASGSYPVYVVNGDGGTGVRVNGINHSALPAWVTSSVGPTSSVTAVDTTLNATDATSYTITTGSLPTGLSLASGNGRITGTTESLSSNTTYNFTVNAVDAQLQDSSRSFSWTIYPGYGTYITSNLFMHFDLSNPSSYSGSGSTLTDLQGTRNGTITGAAFGGTGYAKYLDFEADSVNYVQFGSDIPSGQSTSALTLEAWIYTESLAGTYITDGIGAIISSQNDGAGYRGASLNTDTRATHGGGPNCYHPQIGTGGGWFNGSYNTPDGTGSVSNRWDHVVMVWSNGAPVDVYENGSRISTNNSGATGSINWGSTYWSLGRQLSNGGFPGGRAYDGKIAIARIYNAALSSSDILANYNGQKSRFGL